MKILYLTVGTVILMMGVITYLFPATVRYISLTRRPRTTSIMTLILGIAMIVVGFLAA